MSSEGILLCAFPGYQSKEIKIFNISLHRVEIESIIVALSLHKIYELISIYIYIYIKGLVLTD